MGVQPVPMGTFRPPTRTPSRASSSICDTLRSFEFVTFWQHSCPDDVEPPPPEVEVVVVVLVLVGLVEVGVEVVVQVDVVVGLVDVVVVVGQVGVTVVVVVEHGVVVLELELPQFGFGMADTAPTRARAVRSILENMVVEMCRRERYWRWWECGGLLIWRNCRREIPASYTLGELVRASSPVS
jgi:hypothetical protein